MRRSVTTCLWAALLCGCNGQIYHGPANLDRPPFDPAGSDPEEAGIIYYPRVQILKTTTTTAINKSTGRCETTEADDIITVADTTRPQRMYYRPAWLEAYKFSASLNADGTLASVGTESTPDQGNTVKNLASGLSSVAEAAKTFALRPRGPVPQAREECEEGVTVRYSRFDPGKLPLSGYPR